MKIFKKINSLPSSVKASTAFFLASLITKGIAYFTTPIYTRLLEPELFGKVSIFLTWLNVFGIIAMFSLMNGVFNNGMVDYPDDRDNYSFSMLILSNCITIITFIVVLLSFPFINQFIDLDFKYIVLMFAVFIFQPAYSFWSARQRYELKYKANFVWAVINALISPLVAILLIKYTNLNRLDARIFGAECALLVVYIVFYFYLGAKNKYKIDTRYWKSAFLFNLPLIPHYLSALLLGSADKIMISKIINDSATAYYSVAYSVASFASVVWTAINASLIPFTYEKCKNEQYEDISKATIPIITLFAVCCTGVIMLAPEIVSLMATSDYKEAIYVIPPVVGGVFFQVQYYIYANVVYYYKKPIYVMIASVVSTVLNIGLNFYFINKYGYIAAGYTTIICYMIQAIIDYFAMKKVVGKSIYNMKYIVILSVVVIIISLLSNLIYDKFIIRYIILFAMALICFIKRDLIKKVLKFR